MSFQRDFINKHSQAVIRAGKGTGIFPSVSMAQMIIESGWGKDTLPRKYNNYFGVKKGGWTGKTVWLPTPKDAKPYSEFRVYNSPQESIEDHITFLQKNKRYEKNGVFNSRTPEEQLYALKRAGYAESATYAPALINLISSYNLKTLDSMSGGISINKKIVIPFLLLGSVFVILREERII